MRDKGFDNRLFNKLEYIGITIVVLLFLSLLFIESRNHSFDLIAKEIQSEVTKEYNSIQSSGEKFVYYKSNLVS